MPQIGRFHLLSQVPHVFHGYSLGYGNIAIPYDQDNTAAQHRKQFINDLGGQWSQLVAMSPELLGPFQEVTQQTSNVVPEEGMITQETGMLLALPLGDCLGSVIAYTTPEQQIGIALAHGSWRSLSRQYPFQVVQHLIQQGVSPDQIFIGVTPGICVKHLVLEYLDETALRKENWEKAQAITHESDGWHLDSKKYLRWQYEQAGVPSQNIEIHEQCTYEVMEQARKAGKTPSLYSHKYAMLHHEAQQRFWLVAGIQQ